MGGKTANMTVTGRVCVPLPLISMIFCRAAYALLLKYAIIDGVLDEDLYQELSIILLKAIKLFKI